MKKYKLVDEAREDGLKRVKALRDFGDVKKGELGGLIASEANLSHDGRCWVYGGAWVSDRALVSGDARVFGGAKVFGNARVFKNAQVSGNSKVSGDARVYGDAQVFDDVWVSDRAQVSGGAKVSGNVWVSDRARVYGGARVYGDAKVSGDARVFGGAKVFGNARVFGDADVSGDAKVSGDALVGGEFSIGRGHLYSRGIKAEMEAVFGIRPIKGYYTLYKRVCKTKIPGVYLSCYDRRTKYITHLTTTVILPEDVDDQISCGPGLHLSTADYWNDGDTLIACKVKPSDVISVMRGKVRCRAVKTIGRVD